MTVPGSDLHRAIGMGGHAPSLHNSQPWRWEVKADDVLLRRDPTRWLHVTDPDGHDQLISCGAALRGARISLTADGWATAVTHQPDAHDPNLLARIHVVGTVPVSNHDLALSVAVVQRVTDRRLLDATRIDAAERDDLLEAVSETDTFVNLIRDTQAASFATLMSEATEETDVDPEQSVELAGWVRDQVAPDGVPLSAVPTPTIQPRHSDIPQRSFSADGRGTLAVVGGVDEAPMFAVVLTRGDDTSSRVQAGEVMMQLMLEAQIRGISTCPASQVVDHPARRHQLSQLLGGTVHAQMVLRMGHPVGTREPLPRTPRRPLSAILD